MIVGDLRTLFIASQYNKKKKSLLHRNIIDSLFY